MKVLRNCIYKKPEKSNWQLELQHAKDIQLVTFIE